MSRERERKGETSNFLIQKKPAVPTQKLKWTKSENKKKDKSVAKLGTAGNIICYHTIDACSNYFFSGVGERGVKSF